MSKITFISKAHSDVVGILFGLLVSVSAILIILITFGIIKIKCNCNLNKK